MSKHEKLNACPVCGSRNLQIEGHGGKGRQVVHCAECDHLFELHISNDKHDAPDKQKS